MLKLCFLLASVEAISHRKYTPFDIPVDIPCSVVQLKSSVCTDEHDPGCDHLCVFTTELVPVCYCHLGYELYDDQRSCVITRAYLEQREREIEEDYVLPVTIICFVGAAVIFLMSAITWYYLVKQDEEYNLSTTF